MVAIHPVGIAGVQRMLDHVAKSWSSEDKHGPDNAADDRCQQSATHRAPLSDHDASTYASALVPATLSLLLRAPRHPLERVAPPAFLS
jgi:hypothetical protein